MAGASPKTIKGADLKMFINGKPFGLVTEFSFQVSNGRRGIYTIDQAEPWEIGEAQSAVTGSMTVIRLRADGGMEGYGVVAPYGFYTLEKYVSITLTERFTDRAVFHTDRALIRMQSWAVGPRNIMVGTLNFEAINWNNDFS